MLPLQPLPRKEFKMKGPQTVRLYRARLGSISKSTRGPVGRLLDVMGLWTSNRLS